MYAEAKRFVACRYTMVEISPTAIQKGAFRKGKFEKRRISEREAWDALNETWGVFVGWEVWNKLEVTDRLNPALRWNWDVLEEFLDRLEAAQANGDLTGYFEPANQAERRGIPRWYLAPSHAISAPEVMLLLEVILGETPGMAQLMVHWISAYPNSSVAPESSSC